MTLQEAILDMDTKVTRGCAVVVKIGQTGTPVSIGTTGHAPEDFVDYPDDLGVELARHICLTTRFEHNLGWTISGDIGQRMITYYHRTNGGVK